MDRLQRTTVQTGEVGTDGREAQSEDELLLVEDVELDELDDSELDPELEEDDEDESVEDELDDDP